jgi:hypothetical protein
MVPALSNGAKIDHSNLLVRFIFIRSLRPKSAATGSPEFVDE